MRHQPLAFLMGLALTVPTSFAGEEWNAPYPGAGHWFGFSVASAEGLNLVGAPLENRAGSQTGVVYLMDTGLVVRKESRITPVSRQQGQRFGWDADLMGDVMVVGAPGSGSMVGQAYVFERIGGAWVQTTILNGMPGHGGDGFGSSVAIEGDRILVGAPEDNGNGPQAGAVYAFSRGVSLWVLDEVIRAPHTGPGDQFGFALDMDGDGAVIGAFSANTHVYNEGAAYVYRWDGASYAHEAELWAATPRSNAMFARCVAILGDRVAVGATEDHANDMRSGSVSLFSKQGRLWSHEDRVQAPGREVGNAFGYAVALKSEGLVVGAPLATKGGVRGGSAFVFHPIGPNWEFTVEFDPPAPAQSGDFTGVTVSLAESGALVGAMRRDLPLYDAGAVFSFTAEDVDVPLIVSFCGCDEGGSCGTAPQLDGCQNSTGAGATMIASGSTSLTNDDLTLFMDGLPRRAPTFVLMGIPGVATMAFDGQYCISDSDANVLVVESMRANGVGFAATRRRIFRYASRKGLTVLTGSSWAFQAMYYDRRGPCGTQYNFSNALCVTLVP
ncbi:MAG: hypothetical protein GY930_12695 [bacterium]|nr:hypothetical protein [bacterium]